MMNIQQFGTCNSKVCKLYTIKNKNGNSITLTDYGAAVVSIFIKDRKGNKVDVILGYDDLSSYEKSSANFGGTIGRVANRIKGGSFLLSNKIYKLTVNDEGKNTLHSGSDFYNKRVWKVTNVSPSSITFYLRSRDMDQGFPGNLDIYVTYDFNDNDELSISYKYKAEDDTIVNLCNHTYFNLSGQGKDDVLNQKVYLNCDYVTDINEDLIPTGEFFNVDDTPFDFRNEKAIGQDINSNYRCLNYAGGYDHNFVINPNEKEKVIGKLLNKVGYMKSDDTGIKMEIFTSLPGVQFYTSNSMKDEKGKNGNIYNEYSGACFETQYFPDAVHHDNFPSTLVKKGEEKEEFTVYRFLV